MPKMKAVQATKPNAPFEVVERDVPEPGPGQVRIKVEACGVCHSDALTRSGAFPGMVLPRIPGHEIAGRVDVVGQGVIEWKAGDRVQGFRIAARGGDTVAQHLGTAGSENRDLDLAAAEVDADSVLGHVSEQISWWCGPLQTRFVCRNASRPAAGVGYAGRRRTGRAYFLNLMICDP